MITSQGVWPLLTISLCSLLTACNWVDSAGGGGPEPQTEVFLDDIAVGGAIVLNENFQVRLTASRDDAATDVPTYVWSDTALDQGNLASCANQNGFKPEFAADNLSKACTDVTQCSLIFERVDTEDGVAEFLLTPPVLKASVGMRYGLTVVNAAGQSNTREFDFCFIAINEAPLASDDTFVIREGIREIISVDQLNLLSNDEDDVDVSNTDLRILTEPSVPPQSAAFFELKSDGSFVYESSLVGILSDQFDSFEYTLSDGLNTSTARVSLRIVTSNQAPERIDTIPLLVATVGEPFSENLSLYFIDPEQGDLIYTFDDKEHFPDDGSLALLSNGLFSGVPVESDVGSYDLTLVTSDGGRQIETDISLQVVAAPVVPENSAPEYTEGSVFDQIILLGRFIRPISAEFTDPDDDELNYTITGRELPNGVTIDTSTGIISGRPTLRVWVRNLRVEATDSFGASTLSDPFYIRVR